MTRAYIRRKRFEAQLIAREVGKLFGGSTSPPPSSSSSSQTVTPPPHINKIEDLDSGTHTVDPETIFRFMG